MPQEISVISSMATRLLLEEMLADYQRISQLTVTLEAVGGVDAVRRLRAREPFDIAVLSASALDALDVYGLTDKTSRVDLVRSGVAIAVRKGAPRVDVGSAAAVRQAVLQARTIGYSTGPSGVQLAKLFEQWGIGDELGERVVIAPPGTPVGKLVADGEVELGFQQLSELMNLSGIEVLGAMPAEIQIETVFSAALLTGSARLVAARAMLAHWRDTNADALKRRHGMDPV